ncbi:MAG: hypothetical protein BZ135_06075 [Methanosphaera sp. rholeuAM6]|nr:MAG: hypothetical protein BZ135_06075 [Methanosphaera sp. rholeuAM6]
MKDIKKQLEQYYTQLTDIFNTADNSPKLLHRKNVLKRKEDEELLTGVVVVSLIVIILLSLGYYFAVFAPQQAELDNLKQEKINQVNTLLQDDEGHNREAIIQEIERQNTVDELESMDVESMVYPMLKNTLLEQLNGYKDKYDRVEITTDNSTDIMSITHAKAYINSSEANTLSTITVSPVDSVIMPLSINRKQAASGLITVGNVVDIYKTQNNEISQEESDEENISMENQPTTSTRIVGGSRVVSILRSKDSGSIEQNLELSQSPKSRNYSQTSSLDIEQILSSKAAGVYNEKELKVLLDDYGTRLAGYERTSQIGELDVEYIIMVEVPRDSVEDLINNMDNIILAIPTYDAPSWVKL